MDIEQIAKRGREAARVLAAASGIASAFIMWSVTSVCVEKMIADGFTPAVFDDLTAGFTAFYRANAADLSKCEYYLPSAVQEQMDKGLCDVKVYPTSSVWQGVTYPEDKPRVKESLAALIAKGEYPASLWDN